MQRWAFEGLEPCDGKLSRTVLRGKGGRKAPDLPGIFSSFEALQHLVFTTQHIGLSFTA